MRQRRLSRPMKWAGLAAILAAFGATVMVAGYSRGMQGDVVSPRQRYQVVDVRRADLFPKVTAGGRVESSKKTIIECELERISIGIRGLGISGGGASTLLSIVPDGSEVKKGDVLAVLDSSAYEELLLQQRITVERVQADYQQSQLELDVAKLAVIEYRDGTMEDTRKSMLGQLALAKSDLERSGMRLAWSKKMNDKGYAPKSQVTSDQYNHSVNLIKLAQQQTAHEIFFRFNAPKVLKQLEGRVKSAEAIMNYQTLRKKRMQERLELLEKQVTLCTIRAPHDGFVIYANDPNRNIVIEPGMTVRQQQDLMYLPDLDEMEVVAMLHESIMEEVRAGMAVDVELEGLPDRRLEGHVVSVAPLPSTSWISDVRYFPGIVKLDHSFKGIRPGMTARCDIRLGRRDRVLTIPPESVVSEGGHDVCYVAHEDGIERREVKLGHVTQEFLEITGGLDEGEQIVLNPVGNPELAQEIGDAPLTPIASASEPEQESPTIAAVVDTSPRPKPVTPADPIASATH